MGVYTIPCRFNLKKDYRPGCRVISLPYFLLTHSELKVFRKEVIHPKLRLGIPCYDLSFIAEFGLLRQNRSSATPDFAALTGGVYKTRERIHRDLLIRDYYRFRLHEVGLQTSI